MVKKMFALASVTALTGLMAAVVASGCSTTTTTDAPDSATPGADAKLDTAKDTSEPEAAAPTCPTTTPITAAEIEASGFKWLPPAAIQTVCTQKNIDDLKALFKAAPAGGGVKFADIKTALGTACSACAFSPIAGPNWQVFVEDKSGAIDNRTGSCFAQLENADCGKKRAVWEQCLDAACPEADCGSADKVQTCGQKAQKSACKDLTEVYAKACPNEGDILPVCGNIFSAIAVSCSGGADAGIDASTQ